MFWVFSPAGAATVSAVGWVAIKTIGVNAAISRCSRLWGIGRTEVWRYSLDAVRRIEVMPKNHFNAASLRAARKARTARANERAAKLGPILKKLRATGVTSLSGIAAALNRRRIRTPGGVGQWRATQVARELARLPA
jgi:hypothetical protein